MSLPAPSTIIRGRSWVWPDDVNTDIIIPFRFKARTNDPVEMAKYAMYGFDPEFYKKVKDGKVFHALPVPDFLRGLMREGGLVEYYKNHKTFPWEHLSAA